GGRAAPRVPPGGVGPPSSPRGAAPPWAGGDLRPRAGGTRGAGLAPAAPFPRHSLYGVDGRLVAVLGALDLELEEGTPWGDFETPAFAAAVESELERRLATAILREGSKLVRRRVARGERLVEQGQPGTELFVLLDGVLDVEIDGAVVAQVGSGAILGEKAVLGDGHRTATLRAVRSSRVAVIRADEISRPHLVAISASHN